jgi:hypothetical protein
MLLACLLLSLLMSASLFSQTLGEIKYSIGSWDPDKLGNHRVKVLVTDRKDAILVHIPWRRRDQHPEKINIIIIDAERQKEIDNKSFVNINREFGEIIFQPQKVPGYYYFYYMPYISTGRSNYPTVTYQKPECRAQKTWLERHGLINGNLSKSSLTQLPRGKVLEIQSVDQFNSYYPMEIIATAAEVQDLILKNPDFSYLLFPEDRKYPIRMKNDIPHRWIKLGNRQTFEGKAARGEFYAFQIGLYAVKNPIKNINVHISPLKGENTNEYISKTNITCFNLGGINWHGKPFKKSCTVLKGKVQPLWFGIQVPRNLNSGNYKGNITVLPGNAEEQTIQLQLKIGEEVLKDAGDNEPWRHSRLRWLNSRIAFNDEVIGPFTPLEVVKKGNKFKVNCLGRSITVGKSGLPVSIKSFFSSGNTKISENAVREILSAPLEFVVKDSAGNPLVLKGAGVRITKQNAGIVSWESSLQSEKADLSISLNASMELDGFLGFKVYVESEENKEIQDISLRIPVDMNVAEYMMGLGLKGGNRPNEYSWKWDVKKNQDSLWIGHVNAGLQCSFRDNHYSRPLNTNFYHSKPLIMPESWCNKGKGGINIREIGDKEVLISAYSGERTLLKGGNLSFNFNLLITPFKPLDIKNHWKRRYFHRYKPLKEIQATGANTINVHHATEINPFINYPFLRPGHMKAYIDKAHDMALKVKIYYTIRELSNRSPEIFALQSLGNEVISEGPGGGFSWLQEHLNGNYISAWFVPRLKDAAVINSGMSRWHNYYLEGLNWLVKNTGIDGLYIDDLAFDRTTMKRLRKILNRGKKEAIIDLHSANQYNPRDGYANSANLYLEHFPYIDRLWFGEYFKPHEPADFWLIEMSGIPFGLMGEMLQDGGNTWRGMLYGMTARLPWAGDPRPIWELWDRFGISKSEMMGYWNEECPVKTNHKEVLATVYVRKGHSGLVALASWAGEDVLCKLDINWRILGLDPEKVKIIAPKLEKLQPAFSFGLKDTLPVKRGQGWFLVLIEK